MNKGFKPAKPKPLPKIYVVPVKAGEGPRDPRSRAKLPEEGAWVPDNSFWNRRLRFKEVERDTPPKGTEAEPATEPEPATTRPKTRAPAKTTRKPTSTPKATSSEE